jgi:hypothetical protein
MLEFSLVTESLVRRRNGQCEEYSQRNEVLGTNFGCTLEYTTPTGKDYTAVTSVEIKPWQIIVDNRIWQNVSHNSRFIFQPDFPPVCKDLNLDVSALLGHYAGFSGNSLPTLRNNLWVPSSRVKEAPEDEADMSRNVRKELRLRAAKYPRRAHITSTSRRKLEITFKSYLLCGVKFVVSVKIKIIYDMTSENSTNNYQ